MVAIREAVERADAAAINGARLVLPLLGAFHAAQKLEGIEREGDLSHAGEAFRLLEEQISLLQSATADFDKVGAA